MAWGIADTASQIEKIRAESSDYLGGLDSVGEIDYTTYCKLWDYYHDLLGKAYEQGLIDAPNDKRKEAEPVRHGRWVNHISEDGATDGIYCSICDYEIDRDARYKYCPNCGAKMEEEDETETG
jgi:hypothetical protein